MEEMGVVPPHTILCAALTLACSGRASPQRKDMEEMGAVPPKALPSLYETISSDEDAVLKTIMHITSGITSIVDKVQK